MVRRQWSIIRHRGEVHRDQNDRDHRVMSRIDIDRLVEREGDVAAVECRIRRGVVCLDGRLREARDELLDVADALGGGSWMAGSVAVPELDILGETFERIKQNGIEQAHQWRSYILSTLPP